MHLVKPRQNTAWMEQMSARHFFHFLTFAKLCQTYCAPQHISWSQHTKQLIGCQHSKQQNMQCTESSHITARRCYDRQR